VSSGRKAKESGRIGRWTPQRLAILNVFLQNACHLSAEDVYLRVRNNGTVLGMATIYRNLEFLCSNRLLRRYSSGNAGAKYELNDDEAAHHHHMVCRICGNLIDYSEFVKRELSLIDEIEKELEKNYGFKISSHQLEFRGVCGDCRE